MVETTTSRARFTDGHIVTVEVEVAYGATPDGYRTVELIGRRVDGQDALAQGVYDGMVERLRHEHGPALTLVEVC